MTSLVMHYHRWWQQQHVILITLSVAPLHFFGQYDQNDMQHDFFSHTIPLAQALVSHDADGIVNGTIPFYGLW